MDEGYEHKGKWRPEHRWKVTWKPIKQWTFDQYGSEDGSWRSPGTITLWQNDLNYDCRLVVKGYRTDFTISTDIDQWGTYYASEGRLYVASEEGTRSFWIAWIEAQQMLADAAEFKMKEPDSERFNKTTRELYLEKKQKE